MDAESPPTLARISIVLTRIKVKLHGECKHIFNSSTYDYGCCTKNGKCRPAIHSNDISIIKTLQNFDQEPYLAICVKNSRKK